MKFSNLFILLMALTIFSCKDDCETPPAPAANVIGSWTSNLDGSIIEFKPGNELIDPDGALIDNGLEDQVKTYTFNSENSVEIKTEAPGGSLSTNFTFNNISCDEISLGFLGLSVGFMRQN